MKANYSISSARAMITRNRGKFEGKQIIIPPPGPGIKMLGAIDFLKAKGYLYNPTPLKPREKANKGKSFNQIVSDFKQKLLISLITGREK
jgi:hypothetical protein